MAQLEQRYADALLELSTEASTLETDLADATLVRDALDDKQTEAYLLHPHIADDSKLRLFHTAFGDRLNPELDAFIRLLIQKNREDVLTGALDHYIRMANLTLGRVEARVVTASEMSPQEEAMMREKIRRLVGKDITMHTAIDPDIIGGFYILVDGYVYDATIRSELHKLRETLQIGGPYAS